MLLLLLACVVQPPGKPAEDTDSGDTGDTDTAETNTDTADTDTDTAADTDTGCAPSTWHLDYDLDGHAGALFTLEACAAPGEHWHASADDCDDLDATVFPGAVEQCDGRDEDCDAVVDEDAGPTWYPDADGDGFGGAGHAACAPAPSEIATGGDCDDAAPLVHPGATDACNGADDDCDGTVDDDADADGADACADCDDASAAVFPGATDVCNGVDDDCDGTVDPTGIACAALADADARILGESGWDYAGASVAYLGDVDADGYGDVLVGATGHEVGGVDAGAAYLVLGPITADVDLADAATKWVGEEVDDRAGWPVRRGGDLDGDGVQALLVAALGDDTTDENTGAVHVVAATDRGELSVGDSWAEFYGEQYHNQLGLSLAGVGDLDGDGADDLLVSSHGAGREHDSGTGAVYLFQGPLDPAEYDATEADAILTGRAGSIEEIGTAADALGDVDGDGCDDFVVGAQAASTAFVVLGPVTADDEIWARADATFTSPHGNAFRSVAGPGDVDGDGLPDVLLGDQYGCTAYVLSGTLRGAIAPADSMAVLTTLTTATCYDFLGAVVGAPGDVDADGYADLLATIDAGDSYYGGAAVLWRGPVSGTYDADSADASFGRVDGVGTQLGFTGYSTGGGDVNGDGYADVLLGAWADSAVNPDQGAVYVWFGGF